MIQIVLKLSLKRIKYSPMNVTLTFNDLDAKSAPQASFPFNDGLRVARELAGQGHGLVLLDLNFVTECLPYKDRVATCGFWRRG